MERDGRKNEEPRRFRTGNGQGIAFVWATVLVSLAQDPNAEGCTKAAAAVQNAVQRCRVIWDGEERPTQPWIVFLKRVDMELNPAGNQDPSRQGQAWTRLQLGPHPHPPSPTAAHPAALPPPPPSAPVRSMPASVCQLLFTVLLYWRRKSQPLQYSCLENPMDGGVW